MDPMWKINGTVCKDYAIAVLGNMYEVDNFTFNVQHVELDKTSYWRSIANTGASIHLK